MLQKIIFFLLVFLKWDIRVFKNAPRGKIIFIGKLTLRKVDCRLLYKEIVRSLHFTNESLYFM